jgi:hypothetical protein
MRKDESEGWPEDVDVDRVRATPRSVVAGWAVVAIIAAVMTIGPPTVSAVDVALVDAKHDAVKIEHRMAQSVPVSLIHCNHPG